MPAVPKCTARYFDCYDLSTVMIVTYQSPTTGTTRDVSCVKFKSLYYFENERFFIFSQK